MAPISRSSRLRARPRVPSSNFSSSLAMAEGRPSTLAMPSPAKVTVPTSSREAASGWYDWTKFSSASRISSGRIVSSAIWVPCSPCWARSFTWGVGGLPPIRGESSARPNQGRRKYVLLFSITALLLARHTAGGVLEPVRQGAVDDLVADLYPDPADDLGVHVEIEVHPAPVELREGGAEALLLRVAQRH